MNNIENYVKLIDQASELIAKALNISWNEIHKFEDVTCEEANYAWDMHDYAEGILNYIDRNYPEALPNE